MRCSNYGHVYKQTLRDWTICRIKNGGIQMELKWVIFGAVGRFPLWSRCFLWFVNMTPAHFLSECQGKTFL
jgi:hypothetical protein